MSDDNLPVVAIVIFKTMHSTDSIALRQLLEQAGPAYTNIPNLRRKYFISGDGVGGGIYEWTSRAKALAFYDEAWHSEAKQRFGSVPEITFYDAPAIADGIRHTLEIFI